MSTLLKSDNTVDVVRLDTARDRPAIEAFFAENRASDKAVSFISDSLAMAFAALRNEIEGIASWRPLAWDSKHFGFPAARLDVLLAKGGYAEAKELKIRLLQRVLESCAAQGIRHLTARLAVDDLAGIHALERSGFELIDGIQTFALRLSAVTQQHAVSEIATRPFEPDDLSDILEIARSAYTNDRFHSDPSLPTGTADAVFEDWARNSCLGTAADAVIVAAKEKQILGFATCKIDSESTGEIGLVATAAAARRCGVARAVSLAGIEWFRSKGSDLVQVGTQLTNISAARVYQQCGFMLVSTNLTFRRLF